MSDLDGLGVETDARPQVGARGNIDLPYVEAVKAEGLTSLRLDVAIGVSAGR